MIRFDTYFVEQPPRRNYQKARKRKEQLKADGWRVKIRKDADGLFQIWKKHISVMDLQQHHGNGRRVPA